MNDKNQTILITGGTGFVGTHLTRLLQDQDFLVNHLSRTVKGDEKVKTYRWDPLKGYMDEDAVQNVDYIIHLAGEGIADKPWTKKRKESIIQSRVKTAELLFDTISRLPNKIKAFISASAVGYYGTITSDKIFSETDPPAKDFTAHTCTLWEQAADRFSTLKIRTVKIRTAVVFGPDGGALPKIAMPIKYYIGAAFGSGKQYFPWIHVHDLCRIYLMAITNDSMQGAYNAAALEHITNKELTQNIAKVLGKPILLPNVPAFALKLALGEMSVVLLKGSRVSSKKIQGAGFKFEFPKINEALEHILK